MEQKDAAILFKTLTDDACKHIIAGISQQEFFKLYKCKEAERNMLIKHTTYFTNMWKNYEQWEPQKK